MNTFSVIPKFILAGLGAASLIVSSAAIASSYLVEADVISVQPVYRSMQVNIPVQQCSQEPVSVPGKQVNSYTPEILGAIVGAGVGRLFGSGRGQDAATAAGAVLGGSIGRDQKNRYNRRNTTVEYVEQCKTVNNYESVQQIDGYTVRYEYEGQVHSTLTRTDPGDTITLRVSHEPEEV